MTKIHGNKYSKRSSWCGFLKRPGLMIPLTAIVTISLAKLSGIFDVSSVNDSNSFLRAVTPREVATPTQELKVETMPVESSGKVVGLDGGAWTALTHLTQYGFNPDWGLMEVLEDACREAENSRNTDSQWFQKKYEDDPNHPLNGYWMEPRVVDCRAIEIGCGVGVYVDALKKENRKRKRKVFGIEPNPMGGTFERGNKGPQQLAINFLDNDNTFAFARSLRDEKIGKGISFDLIYSIEVFEHMPRDRHEDAACFLAGLASTESKLIFGAARRGQQGVGHIGTRSGQEWVDILSKAGFDLDLSETARTTQQMQEFNHRTNTRVYKYRGDAGINCSTTE